MSDGVAVVEVGSMLGEEVAVGAASSQSKRHPVVSSKAQFTKS
jgi:hypothetical protein